MYRTEGYVDQDTYLAKEHVWSHVIRHQGKLCFCWWVSEGAEEQRRYNRIKDWMRQELTEALGKGITAIKKELIRFGALLNSGKLFLYYQRQLWQYSEESGLIAVERWELVSERVGLFVSESLEKLQEVQEVTRGISKAMCLAQIANCIQSISLRAMSEGRLQQGYFFLWEATDAI